MKPRMNWIDEASFSDERSRGRMRALRDQLLAEAVRFVKEGATNERGNRVPDRVREASDLAGVPRVIIEEGLKR